MKYELIITKLNLPFFKVATKKAIEQKLYTMRFGDLYFNPAYAILVIEEMEEKIKTGKQNRFILTQERDEQP
jgi:hypothetical protein